MASKSKLNELVQKRALGLPVYITNSRDGGYSCDLKIGKQNFKSEQVHSKKKAAEDDVAAVALRHFTAEGGDQLSNQQASYTARSTGNSDIITNKSAAMPTLAQREIAASLFKTMKELSPSNQDDKPSQKLQDYCCSQGWTEPIYNLKTVGGRQASCGVLVNGKLYSYDDTYSSSETAKQETAKRLLDELTKPKSFVDSSHSTTSSSFPAVKQSHPVTAQLTNDVEKMTLTNPSQQEAFTNGTSSPDDNKPKVSDKNMLQHLCHKKGLPPPEYTTEYPDGTVGYISEVTVDGKSFRSLVQGSKKVAEAAAAREAIKYLRSSDTTLKATSPTPLKISGKV